MRYILRFMMLGLVVQLCAFVQTAQAITFILDNTNGYAAEIEPGAFIEQPFFDLLINPASIITGTNVEFAIGPANSAVFTGQTQIGSGTKLGGFRAKELVAGNVPFALKTASGMLYDATLTYFLSTGPGGGSGLATGIPPNPDNNAGSVWEIEKFVAPPVPEPATCVLSALGLVALGIARRRKSVSSQ